MTFAPQIQIPATYMRGGTSKGVFFNLEDLPKVCKVAGPERDAMLLRVIGSPDPYGKQTDGNDVINRYDANNMDKSENNIKNLVRKKNFI